MSRLVERHKVTHFGSAPTLIRGMAGHEQVAMQGDRSSVRLLITAGEGIAPEHFNWFQRVSAAARQPLINYTGGTEVSGALLASVPSARSRPAASTPLARRGQSTWSTTRARA
jgi:acetyl-CoA synthetase